MRKIVAPASFSQVLHLLHWLRRYLRTGSDTKMPPLRFEPAAFFIRYGID